MSDETFRWVVAGGVGLAALSFVVMGVVAVVIANVVLKIKAKLDPLLDAARPVVSTVTETVAVMKPKIIRISDQAVEVSTLVVAEAHRYADISKDVAVRAKAQVARIDGALDSTVDEVKEASGAVKGAVMRPIREVDGVLSGVRTAIATFARGRRLSVNRVTQDEEMFI